MLKADEFFSDFGISIISVTDEHVMLIEVDDRRFVIQGDGIDEFKKTLIACLESQIAGIH